MSTNEAEGQSTGQEFKAGANEYANLGQPTPETPGPKFDEPESWHRPQPETGQSAVNEKRQPLPKVIYAQGKPEAPVINAVKVEPARQAAEAAPATPESESASKINFNIGDTVSVTRSSGDREHDWKITSMSPDGKYVVQQSGNVNAEGKMPTREYTPEELTAVQFVPGDTVKHFEKTAFREDWQIYSVKPSGEVTLMRGGGVRASGEDELVYRGEATLSQLYAEQQPGYQPPQTEASAAPAASEPAEPKRSWRQRLGNRIAGYK